MKKPSFLSRITGLHSRDEDFDDTCDDDCEHDDGVTIRHLKAKPGARIAVSDWNEPEEENEGGELAVDIYQTPEAIVLKTFIAGVAPSTIDIALTREMITLTGTRTDEREVEDEDYFHHELYWGTFSRTVMLPEEVDVDQAEASEKHGVLVIRLPKIDKRRQAKLKVKSR